MMMTNLPNEINLLLDLIYKNGGKAYYVGGYVRDKYLNKPSKDVDIELFNITEEQLVEFAKQLSIELTLAGESFPVYKFKDIDLSFPRTEQSTGPKHTDFEVTVDPFVKPEIAALRRDLTINSLMQDVLTGEILDFYGGLDDLQNKVLRHVSDKFVEDPLRVYRLAQFQSRFDGFTIAPETLELATSLDTSSLSSERIWEETKKALLKSKKPSVYFKTLDKLGKLSEKFEPLAKLDHLVKHSIYEQLDYIAKSDFIDDVKLIYMLQRLFFTEPEKLSELTNHSRYTRFLKIVKDDYIIDAFLYLIGEQLLPKTLYRMSTVCSDILSIAEVVASTEYPGLVKGTIIPKSRHAQSELYQLYKLRLTGADLLELGIQQGPQIGEMLKYSTKLLCQGYDKETVIEKIKSKLSL